MPLAASAALPCRPILSRSAPFGRELVPRCRRHDGAKIRMSDNENIYVDAGQPATLLDGTTVTDCPTLQEAVIAWHHLSPELQTAATIRTAANVFTAQEINRLHYGPGSGAKTGKNLAAPPKAIDLSVAQQAPIAPGGVAVTGVPPSGPQVQGAQSVSDVSQAQPSIAAAPFSYGEGKSSDYAAARRTMALQSSVPAEPPFGYNEPSGGSPLSRDAPLPLGNRQLRRLPNLKIYLSRRSRQRGRRRARRGRPMRSMLIR